MTEKKQTRVIGFGAKAGAGPNPNKSSEEKINPLSIEEQLVQVILQRYAPAASPKDADEQKTSTELMDEMDSVVEPQKNILFVAMKDAGFKLHYTGESFVWLLKERQF